MQPSYEHAGNGQTRARDRETQGAVSSSGANAELLASRPRNVLAKGSGPLKLDIYHAELKYEMVDQTEALGIVEFFCKFC